MSRLAMVLLVACTRADPPPPPPQPVPVPSPPRPPTPPPPIVPLDAAAPVDAALAGTAIQAVPMVGPFKSIGAACRSAAPCGFTKMDASGKEFDPPKTPDCRTVEDPAQHVDTDTHDMNGVERMTSPHDDVRFAGVQCADPPGMRGAAMEYYAFVDRPDGWWRSAGVLLSTSYNEKYCNAPMSATWENHGPHLIARVTATVACISCGKQGDDDNAWDLVIGIDRAGDKPATYPALVVGQSEHEAKRPDGELAPGDTCKRDYARRLAVKWTDADTFDVTGAKTWRPLSTDGPGFHVWINVGPDTPSSAGTYRLVR